MIDYSIIAASVDFYRDHGFSRIESPWAVTKEVIDITKPVNIPDSFYLNHTDKGLVASGEQSFLYLYLKGFLPKGVYQTVTPCFRYETFGGMHTKYFIKNELIDTAEVTAKRLRDIVYIAESFFIRYLDHSRVRIVETGKDQFDIMYESVELGSYGIRSCDFLDWIYATGVAEPRLSATIQKYRHGIS